MAIAAESLLFLLGGVILAYILFRTFGRSAGEAKFRGNARVKLERTMNPADGVEETRLLLNEQAILVASSAGVRLADYADEVEQLETLATRMASALDVMVELTRLSAPGKQPDAEPIPVRRLPPSQQAGTMS